jgi:signal transduction histidine kinase
LEHLSWLYRSSTLRLTLLLSAIFAIGMAGAILIALTLGEDAVLRRVDASLISFAAAVEVDDEPEDGFAVIVRPLSELAGLPRQFASVAREGGGTVNLDTDFRRSESWRVLIATDSDGERVLIASPLDDSEDALDLLSNALWTTAGIVLSIMLVIGLAAGLLAQRRLARINSVLQQLGAGDLKARTHTEKSKDDLDDLARQLDRTAADLERLVAQTRNLSASLAHDLRTPLARLRARLETLPDGEERASALDEAERLSGIFDTIMRVANIEAKQGRDGFEPVDLDALAADLVSIFGPVVEDRGKHLTLQTEDGAWINADRDMLIQAMANLIQNAIVHGGSQITVFSKGRTMGVSDDGEGVDPALYDEIIKPMVRLDAARGSDGSGLGLALVRAVADRHAAELSLSKSKTNGLCVALKFTDL